MVSLAFSGIGHAAVPTGEDFSKEMPLHDYLVKSIASDADRKKMALSYYEHFSEKSPFKNLIAYKLKKVAFDHVNTNMAYGDWLPFMQTTPYSVKREQRREYADAEKYDISDVEKMIDSKAPFDDWFSSYVSWLFVASSEGGKVLKSWPSGTDPLVGTITYSQKDGNTDVLRFIPDLNSEFGKKAKAQWEKEQKDGAAIGVNISAFANLVRKFEHVSAAVAKPPGLSDEQSHADRFMKGVIVAIIYSQALETRFLSPGEGKEVAGAPLGAYLDKYEANVAAGRLAKAIKIPVAKDEKRTDYARGFFESLSHSDSDINLIDSIEEMVSKWYFLPLSKKGEPVKFAYRPITGFKKMMAWTLVEFTEKGIQTTSLSPAEESRLTNKFRWQWSPNENPYGHPSCAGWEQSNNPCLSYRFGLFGKGRTLGAYRDVRFIDNASFGIPDLPVD